MYKVSDKQIIFLLCFVLAAVTFGVYHEVSGYDFVGLDDAYYVVDNVHIHKGVTVDSLSWAFKSGAENNWHPLTWLSHMLDWQLYGSDAGKHHVTSLLLHIINSLLVFAVFRCMTGAVWRSWFVAALFALHPLNVESVAWISERKNIVSTFFWMLTILAYIGYVRRKSLGRYLVVVVCFSLGLMAKPMLVTLPFVLLLLDWWPLGRFESERPRHNRKSRDASNASGFQWRQAGLLVREKVVLFVITGVSCVVTYFLQYGSGAGPVAQSGAIAFRFRMANAAISYAGYIWKTLVPVRLAVIYPHRLDKVSFSAAFACVVLIAAVTVFIIWRCNKHRYLLVGWLWYLGTIVPVIGLVQVGQQAMADRYAYVSTLGLFLIFAWGGGELVLRWRFRRSVAAVLIVVILSSLAVRTYFQQSYWQDSEKLFGHAIEVVDRNHLAHLAMAHHLHKKGEIYEAIVHYQNALEIKPNDVEAYVNLGSIFLEQGKPDEAIAYFNTAISYRAEPEMYNGLGRAYHQKGMMAKAIECYEKSVTLDGKNANALNSLGIAYAQLNRIEKAIEYFKSAAAISPDVDVYDNLGRAYLQAGRVDEAIEVYKKALEIAVKTGREQAAAEIRKYLRLCIESRTHIQSNR